MKLLKIINSKAEVLSHIDPDRIYVENIRSFYNLPVKLARFLCDMAARQNIFEKWYSVECPICGRVVQSFKNKSEIPEQLNCSTCEMLEKDTHLFTVSKNDIEPFYKLIKRS